MAQKVKLDTLDIDQLNLYKHKAVTMRNTGIILTSCGVGILIASNIVGYTLVNIPSDDPYDPWGGGFAAGLAVLILGNGVGLATIVVGIPLWEIGGSRKANAEFYTLDIDQYKDKAVTTRNTGMILTLSGIGVAVTGIIIYLSARDEFGAVLGFNSVIVGTATTIAGIPLWAIGGSRKAKAELALQAFNIAPKNSMAVGLGITIRF